MRNIKLVLEYDGTAYNGWQYQENGVSVQQKIEEAILAVTGEMISVKGSGRTDAGVHALGQVANFHTGSTIPGDKFKFALNNELPDDIRVIDSQEVDMSFHSRFSATHKRYRYRIYTGEVERPMFRNFCYHFKYPLDIDIMRYAAEHFIGSHDFKSFKGRRSITKTTVRKVNRIDIRQKGEMVDIWIDGDSFMRNMVRIMVGTLVEIGNGQRDKDSIPWILEQRDRNCAGHTAPAKGLFLEKVFYE
ncbi:tRNA pseudouridine(38-40) synthase TruA [Gudongella oleilytica]|jgi:tRNA pseudouridine38-40 synthase|uniref:tRNA pseudouridine(38-40) synthase TruA n=1 Tax=Gudongella oleilytica TaxID=1582259 RepID=UPI000FF87760|nr:tRNA pseudouridine(38-40) synthase TruA [Gudongella oleilytica]